MDKVFCAVHVVLQPYCQKKIEIMVKFSRLCKLLSNFYVDFKAVV